MQLFKETDNREIKVRDAGLKLLDLLGADRDAFYNGAYEAYPLGDVFINLNNSPLARAIPPEAFRASFFAIHELFTRPGTFDFYLTVFRAIFGAGATITFTIPAPGKLEIGIESLSVLLENFAARRIANNAYFYDDLVTENGDNLVFQGSQGIKTQAEVDALMKELAVQGVYTTATLTIS